MFVSKNHYIYIKNFIDFRICQVEHFLILTLCAIAENKENNRPEFRVTATVFEDLLENPKKEVDEKTEKKDEKEEVKKTETAKKVVEKTFVDTTAKGVWHQILVLLEKMRKENNMVSVFPR